MNPRHNNIAPLNTSFVNSTRFPCPPSNGGGGSGIRGRMRRPRRRSLPPLLPYPEIPLTRPPMGLPMYQLPLSYGSLPPMSPAPSCLPYYTPAPVVNYNAALPPLPFTRPSGSLLPMNAHRRGNSKRMIYQKPTEMPIGLMPNEVPGVNESHGEANDVMNVLLTDYMDHDKIFYVYSEDDLEIVFREGSENRTEDSLGHSEFGLSDPKHAKRVLANEESYACSNAKKARRSEELDDKVSVGVLVALQRSLSVLEDENKLTDDYFKRIAGTDRTIDRRRPLAEAGNMRGFLKRQRIKHGGTGPKPVPEPLPVRTAAANRFQ